MGENTEKSIIIDWEGNLKCLDLRSYFPAIAIKIILLEGSLVLQLSAHCSQAIILFH